MNAELIAVGTELLLGEISNTDGQFISECLSELGINVFYHTVVGDNPKRLSEMLRLARSRSDLIITTGGLGPTYDDLTKEVICETFGKRLVMHEPSLERIVTFFRGIGREMTENNKKQALLPEGCIVLENDWGTAPGCVIEAEDCVVAMLPGPPRECKPMMRERLMKYLISKEDGVIYSHKIRIFGMGESAVETLLLDMMVSSQNPTVAPYAKDGEVMLRVTAKAKNKEEAEKQLSPAVEKIRSVLGDVVYGVDTESLEESVVKKLTGKNLTVSCAESCTGGLLSKRLTDIPGSSKVFPGAVISYSNEVKENILAVPEKIIDKYGAVSPATAVYMAMGASRMFESDIAVGITGIAGPDGGSDPENTSGPDKPVGLCYIALCIKGTAFVREFRFGNRNRDRAYIRNLAASNALKLILDAADRI
jgi:nicotinamide-nucleotide amidase